MSSLVRFVITEEMLAAGAPCFAHWVADRQSGPQILRNGTERARRELLPRICRGECYFGIGMSEPDSGSDLAAVRTRAVKASRRLGHQRLQDLDLQCASRPLPDRAGAHRRGGRRPSRRAHPVHHRHGPAGRDGAPDPQPRRAATSSTRSIFARLLRPRRHDGRRRGPGLVAGHRRSSPSSARRPTAFCPTTACWWRLINRVGAEPDRWQAAEIGRLVGIWPRCSACRRRSRGCSTRARARTSRRRW